MRFTITTALLALASSVIAQTPGFDVITKPTQDEVVPAGSTYVIEWEPSTNYTGTVTIDLLGGADQGSLQVLSTIAKGADSAAGKYSWPVDESLGTLSTYGLRLALDSDASIFQYSHPFAIGATSSSSSASASGSATESGTVAPSGTGTAEPTSAAANTTITTATATAAPTGGNLSTTGTPSKTKTLTTLTTTASKTGATGTTVPSNPAAIVGASSVALFGGLAMAIFAL